MPEWIRETRGSLEFTYSPRMQIINRSDFVLIITIYISTDGVCERLTDGEYSADAALEFSIRLLPATRCERLPISAPGNCHRVDPMTAGPSRILCNKPNRLKANRYDVVEHLDFSPIESHIRCFHAL